MKFILVIAAFLLTNALRAQVAGSGTIDNSFNINDNGSSPFGILNGEVTSSLVLSDNSVMIAGGFSLVHGIPAQGVTRLDMNGNIVPGFDMGSGFSGTVRQFLQQTDGKIIAVGSFTSYKDTAANNIIRLHNDGTIDQSFTTSQAIDGTIYGAELLPDHKLMVFGDFTPGVLRLHEDGSTDQTYSFSSPFPLPVTAMHVLDNGKAVIGNSVQGAGQLIRLDASGAVDPDFALTGTSFAGYSTAFKKIIPLENGRMLICGQLRAVHQSVNYSGAIIVDSLGSIDTQFNLTVPNTEYIFYDAHLTGGNYMLLAGNKYVSNTAAGSVFLKVNGAGSASPAFTDEISGGINSFNAIRTLSEFTDGSWFVGGNFNNYGEAPKNYCARITGTGKVVPSFNFTPAANGVISATALLSNGRIAIGGSFTSYNGYRRFHLAVLHADGSLDTTFDTGLLMVRNILKIVETADHKLLVSCQDNYSYRLLQLDPDGSNDADFTVSANSSIYDFSLTTNGNILVAGDFTHINLTPMNRIARLLPSGEIDNSFNIGSGANDVVKKIGTQPDGKVLIAGNFQSFNGINRFTLVRLEADGSVDMAFNSGTGFNGGVETFYIRPDGRIILAGIFQSYNWIPVPGILRMHSDGSIDNTFNCTVAADWVRQLLQGPDGCVYLSIQSDLNDIIKLRPNGTVDPDFQPGQTTHPNGLFTNSMILLPDNRIIVAGGFDFYNGTAKNNIVRLHNQLYPTELVAFSTPSAADSCNGSVYLSMSGTPAFNFDIGTGTTVTSNGYAEFHSLCPGIYTAGATDGNNDYFTTTFVVAADSSYILLDPITDTLSIIDSLVSVGENCQIDYAAVQDVYVESYSIAEPDTLIVNWAIVDSQDTNIIQGTYILAGPGNYYLQLQLYCPEKSAGEYLVVTKGILYNGIGLSTPEIEKEPNDVLVYPNPSGGSFTVSCPRNVSIVICNVTGRIVYSSEAVAPDHFITLSGLSNGMYTILAKDNATGSVVARPLCIVGM
jgi:uncharacterized delta-60 repeat protein